MAVQLLPPIINVLRLAFGKPEPSGQLSLLWLMATACEKDLPLATAVEALAADAKGDWKFKLLDFADLLRRGMSIDQALQRVPNLLPAEAVLAAKVGAANGTLGKALRTEAERQSNMLSADVELSLMGSLFYVCGMLAIQGAIVAFLMIKVIPKFKRIFDDFDIELPAMTQSLIESSDWSRSYGLIILVPVAVGALTLPALWLMSVMGIRHRSLALQRLFPRLDVGPILQQLGVVVSEGKPITAGLHVVSTQHPNTATWKKMSYVYEAVKAGEQPWVMMQDQKLLSERERHLLESAERAGNLGWALQLLGQQIESRQDHAIKAVLQLVRPICIGIVGIFVAWIAVSMFAPLLKLLNDLA